MRLSLLTPALAICAGLLTASGLTGCKSTPNTSQSASQAETAATLPALVFADEDLISRGHRVVWRVDLSLREGTRLAHAAHLEDRIVTIEHPNNLVSVFDANTGQRLWSKAVGDPRGQTFGPVRFGDTLLINNEIFLYEFNIDTGRQRSRFRLPMPASTHPTVTSRNLIFGAADGTIWAQRQDSAGLEWAYRMGSKITSSPVLLDGNRVIVADAEGNVVLLNENGIKVWAARAHDTVIPPVAVSGLMAYVASNDQAVYGLVMQNGRDLWPAFRADVPLNQALLADGTGCYIPVPGKQLVAINATDGNTRWTFDEAARPVADDADRLLAISEESLVLLSKESGSVIGRLPSEQLKEVFVLGNRQIVAVSESGHLAKVALR